MGWRFRRSIRIAPGLRINLSKSGASLSVGKRGFTTNIGPRGTRTTVSIPGTGISYQTSSRRARISSTSGARPARSGASGLVGLGALVLVGFLIYGASKGGRKQETSVESQGIISPAQATPTEPVVPTLPPLRGTPRQTNRNSLAPPTSVQVDTPPAVAMNSFPRMSAPLPAVEVPPSEQKVTWRHVTANGVRWSLRHVGGTLLLIVDLGSGKVANVNVAPAFEALDLPGMNTRIDYIRSFVSQNFPLQTASYSFDRNGNIRLLP